MLYNETHNQSAELDAKRMHPRARAPLARGTLPAVEKPASCWSFTSTTWLILPSPAQTITGRASGTNQALPGSGSCEAMARLYCSASHGTGSLVETTEFVNTRPCEDPVFQESCHPRTSHGRVWDYWLKSTSVAILAYGPWETLRCLRTSPVSFERNCFLVRMPIELPA